MRVEACGNSAQFSISDEGKGMPAAALPRLFNRFYHAENAQSANISEMGVGLHALNEILTLHGGTIRSKLKVSRVREVASSFRYHYTIPCISQENRMHRVIRTHLFDPSAGRRP